MSNTPSTPDLLKEIQELQSELGRLQLRCSDQDRAYWALSMAYEALHGVWWELNAGPGAGLQRIEESIHDYRDRCVKPE